MLQNSRSKNKIFNTITINSNKMPKKYCNNNTTKNISENTDIICANKNGNYICEMCDYITSRKSSYIKHCSTKKHKTKKCAKMNNNDKSHTINDKRFICECGLSYKHRQSLHTHKKKCAFLKECISLLPEQVRQNSQHSEIPHVNESPPQMSSNVEHMFTKMMDKQQEMMIHNQEMMSQNQQLIEKLTEVAMQPKIVNNQFNLMNYLNTECADAMNMSDFIDSVEVTNESLFLTRRKGFQHAFEKLFIDALEEVGEKRRPIHCTDRRRKRFVVKEDGVWQREEDGNPILNRAMHGLNDKQFEAMQRWKAYHPDWLDRDDYLDFTNGLTQELCLIYKQIKKKKIMNTIARKVFINKVRNDDV